MDQSTSSSFERRGGERGRTERGDKGRGWKAKLGRDGSNRNLLLRLRDFRRFLRQEEKRGGLAGFGGGARDGEENWLALEGFGFAGFARRRSLLSSALSLFLSFLSFFVCF